MFKRILTLFVSTALLLPVGAFAATLTLPVTDYSFTGAKNAVGQAVVQVNASTSAFTMSIIVDATGVDTTRDVGVLLGGLNAFCGGYCPASLVSVSGGQATYAFATSFSTADMIDASKDQVVDVNLRGFNSAGRPEYFTLNSALVLDVKQPSEPKILGPQTGARFTSSVVTWDPANDLSGIRSYRVEIRGEGTKFFAQTVDASVLKFDLAQVPFDGAVKVRVAAIDYANRISAVTDQDYSIDRTGPAAVGNLKTQVSASAITISWSAPADADVASYRLFRDGAELTAQGKTVVVSNFTDIVSTNTTHTYSVAPVDDLGNQGKMATVTSAVYVAIVPGIPTDLKAEVSADATTLKWTASSDAVIYRVMRDGKQIAETSALTFVDSAARMNIGKTYVYTVKAVSKDGVESALSAAVTTTAVADTVTNTNTPATNSSPAPTFAAPVNANPAEPAVTPKTKAPAAKTKTAPTSKSTAKTTAPDTSVVTAPITATTTAVLDTLPANIEATADVNANTNTAVTAAPFAADSDLGSQAQGTALKNTSRWPLYLWTIIVLIAVGGGGWLYYSRMQTAEKVPPAPPTV